MEGCGKRIDLYHNEYAICGKDYSGKVYLCDKCKEPRNLAKPTAQPALSEVLAKIRHRAVSVNCGTIEIDDGALEDVLSEYFA